MKLSSKGIVIGGLVDVVLSVVLGVALAVYVVLSRGLEVRDERVHHAIAVAIQSSTGLYGAKLAIGIACSVLGGYVAARLARRDELVNGILASWLCVGIGAYCLFAATVSESQFAQVVCIAITPLWYLLGAFLAYSLRAALDADPATGKARSNAPLGR